VQWGVAVKVTEYYKSKTEIVSKDGRQEVVPSVDIRFLVSHQGANQLVMSPILSEVMKQRIAIHRILFVHTETFG